MMKRIVATVAALGVLAPMAVRAQDSKSESGWVSLFDGKSLDGWEKTGNAASVWEVKDGALCGSGPASMLASTKGPYTNFRFRAEIKINDNGNSGMYFRCKPKPGFTDGVEVQINSTHRDPVRTGSIYTMVEVFEQLVPPDTWFTQEVEVRDVNYRGKPVSEYTVSVNGRVLYKVRDFAPAFKSGYFAFQQHDPGSKVCIRKVEVQELK